MITIETMLQFSFFLVASCLSTTTVAQQTDTIGANQSIHDPDSLISNGKKFKLYFFSPPNSGGRRYVGVSFNLPVETVIWVANRDNPLLGPNGSLRVSTEGNLVISDGRSRVVWTSGLPPGPPRSLTLLDTGNLVLRDNSHDTNVTYAWESFGHPSDSWVEKMTLDERTALTSWRSPDDPARGDFSFAVEPLDGIVQAFVREKGSPRFRSGPWNGQSFDGHSGKVGSFHKRSLQVVQESPDRAYMVFALLPDVLMYVRLDSSGALEERVWSDEKLGWDVTWRSGADDCDSYGKCGGFGSCSIGPAKCGCFPGFDTREWGNRSWSGGSCVRKTGLGCSEDGFLKVGRVKLPDHGRWFASVGDECRKDCLDNCSCVAYALVEGIGCLRWSEELIDVRKVRGGGLDLYIRLAHSELGNMKDHIVVIAVTISGVMITILVCACFLRTRLLKCTGKREFVWDRKERKRKNEHMLSPIEADTRYLGENLHKHNVQGVKLEELCFFKFQMLSSATGKFDPENKLGQGGFGSVYRGKLLNGQEIAVKRLSISSNQGREEFMNEVQVISKLQHRNLVRLLGCCVDSEENMLVYEYLSNGSLDSYIFGSRKREFLDWQTRANIIEGICRGLLYLHRDSRLRIIHRDLKASNILLDTNLNPKISDFGTARIYCGKEDQAAKTKRVVGTYGYMSPEYALHGMFSEKSDVYSFGVLILEILSGKSASFYHEEQQMFLIAYAWKLWNEEKILDFVDPLMTYADPFKETDVARYANVGLLCVQETAVDRPGISNILSMLSCEISELPRPKQPAFVAVQRLSETRLGRESPSQCSVNDVTVTVVEGR